LGQSPEAALRSGYSPGQLLVGTKRTEDERSLIHEDLRFDWDNLFMAYTNIFEQLAFTLTPFALQTGPFNLQ
jgi:hypothetical protein